jgi:hypothetical protein
MALPFSPFYLTAGGAPVAVEYRAVNQSTKVRTSLYY